MRTKKGTYVGVEMHLGARTSQEVFKYLEVAAHNAGCSSSRDGNEAFERMDLIEVLSDVSWFSLARDHRTIADSTYLTIIDACCSLDDLT